MSIETYSAGTLDDLLHKVYSALLERGTPVHASRGDTIELEVAALELTNPLARLSRSEARGKVFSCLGELCWYLAGNDSLEMIRYYLSAYDKEAVDGKLPGAYGPRLFGPAPANQVDRLIELLKARASSRRAVLQLLNAEDMLREKDVPCTSSLQFLVRGDALDVVAYMRSNDAVRGLTHDVFCFTMLQEMVARSLGLKLGRYFHVVGSLHFYIDDSAMVQRFLDEGFQSTKSPMPQMPEGDQQSSIQHFLQVEAAIRLREEIPAGHWHALSTYWQELARLLEAFGARQARDLERASAIRAELANTVYFPYLNALLAREATGEVVNHAGAIDSSGKPDCAHHST
jgi:thymidylate synthase